MNYIKANPLKTISQTFLEVRVVWAILVLVPTALTHTLMGRGDENLYMHKVTKTRSSVPH